ncbi:MAG: adenylosuccinate synthase [Gemmatimonadota bacterium]|jgi:adenylosuccinate synthase|nr:adenylosuccinate synthase [Gemmatimonadota bacterium]
MFDSSVRTLVVVGAQWGDEGKGKLVDVLAEQADWVVRYQGGANAGHTVYVGEQKTVLHQVPSGILHPGVRCAIGNGVVLDPAQLFVEIEKLVAQGVDVVGRLYVSDRAHLVMPYHKQVDGASSASKAIGTTGRGIGPCYVDKVARRGVRVLDLRNPARLRTLVEAGVGHANEQLVASGSALRASVDETMAFLSDVAPRLLPLAEDVGLALSNAVKARAALLLEGAQGSLLDVDHGTYPFVTSSNTTVGGAATGAGVPPTALHAALGVVKAYTTRVGNGPMPTELGDALGEEIRRIGNEFGATTGRPRRCGWFDGVVARYAARVNGLTALAVTKLDVLDTLPELKLCTGYLVDGELLREFPGDLDLLERAVPQYDVLPGWRRSTADARRWDDLPGEAKRYLYRLEELSGTPIRYVSVGTRRDQIIDVKA